MIIKHRTNLIDDLAEAGKGPAAIHIRNMQQRENYFTLYKRIKYIEVKFMKSVTIFFHQQQIDNITLEIIGKTPLEGIIIVDNVKK